MCAANKGVSRTFGSGVSERPRTGSRPDPNVHESSISDVERADPPACVRGARSELFAERLSPRRAAADAGARGAGARRLRGRLRGRGRRRGGRVRGRRAAHHVRHGGAGADAAALDPGALPPAGTHGRAGGDSL